MTVNLLLALTFKQCTLTVIVAIVATNKSQIQTFVQMQSIGDRVTEGGIAIWRKSAKVSFEASQAHKMKDKIR